MTLWSKFNSIRPILGRYSSTKASDPLLLYKGPEKTKIGLLSSASVAQVAFWTWMKGMEQAMPIDPSVVDSWISSPLWTDVGFGSSVMMVGLAVCYAKRYIAEISIVPGGKALRLTTFDFLGKVASPIDVKLTDMITSKIPNAPSTGFIPIGVNGFTGYFLVDPSGSFHDRKRFNAYIQNNVSKKKRKNI